MNKAEKQILSIQNWNLRNQIAGEVKPKLDALLLARKLDMGTENIGPREYEYRVHPRTGVQYEVNSLRPAGFRAVTSGKSADVEMEQTSPVWENAQVLAARNAE